MDGFERTQLMRGSEKRRYPWGANFKQGYANTEEVKLGKTSPVGAFLKIKHLKAYLIWLEMWQSGWVMMWMMNTN